MRVHNETNRHRLFFYGTLIPVLTMFGLMYAEYDSNKQTVFDTHKTTNRQIELLTISNQSKLDDQSLRHMAITHKLQEHHAYEVDELITFYSKFIHEKNK